MAGAFYTGLGREEFCKIDLKTGKKTWSYTGVDGRFQAAPTIAYGTVSFGVWNQKLYTLDEKTGKRLWSIKRGNSQVNRFVVDDQGRIWYTMIDGRIYCIEKR